MRCLLASFFLASVSLLAGCGQSVSKINIVEAKCSKCHTTDRIYHKRSKAEWDRLVYGMKVRGLELTPDEEKQLMQELYTKLGSDK